MPTAFSPTFTDLIDDFETFLRYAERQPNLLLTGAGDLKVADLWALNKRFSYKAPDYVTPRSRQLDYPLLGFLFQATTVSQLYSVAFGKVNTLVPDIGRIDAYLNLTTEEKYVFLLETAWCYVDWATLDGDDRSGQGAEWFRSVYDKLLTLPTGTPVVITQQYELRTKPDVICLFPTANPYIRAGYWFGWYDIHEVLLPKRDRYTLEIDGVMLTDWAVRFDDDHLYRFYLNPRNPYTGEQYYDPRTGEGWADGYPAAETTLALLNLYEGQRFLYVFDFGDNREFQITVVRHLPDEQSTKIRVVDKVGKAPRQHSSW